MNLYKVNYDVKELGAVMGSDCVYAYTETKDAAITYSEQLLNEFIAMVPGATTKVAIFSVEEMPSGCLLAGVAIAAVHKEAESLITLVGDGGLEIN